MCNGRLAPCTTVRWSNKLRTTAGLTRLKGYRMGNPSAIIELSSKVLDDRTRLRSTLLHEMCHAAAYVLDGVSRPPHGDCFWKWANLAMKCFPDVEVTTRHDYDIDFKYKWACSNESCNVVIQRHSRSVNVDKHVCGVCKSNLIEVSAKRQTGTTSAYNKFISSHSKIVREKIQKRRGGDVMVSQAEVLKECARLWREEQNA